MLYHLNAINFRNYTDLSIDIDGADTIFLIGKNGQGKTNFLEALYFLSYGNSFKTKREDQVISHGKRFYRIAGTFYNEDIKHEIEITYQKKNKKIAHNNNVIIDRKEILTVFPCLIFKHSDIFFVSGAPEFQRQYLDQMLALSHSDYTQALQQYKRVLVQKNASLKKETHSVIPIYNEQLAGFGLLLMEHRKKVVHYINQHLMNLFSEIFGKSINVYMEYAPSWNFLNDIEHTQENIQNIINKMSLQLEKEKQYKFCLSGPHRDTIRIMLNEYEFKNVGSTGQIRILSLLLRSLQTNYYFQQQLSPMVYLFDDVLLELDSEKQKRFLDCLPKAKQAFFTFLPEEHLPYLVEATKKKYFHIQNGHIEESNAGKSMSIKPKIY